ncbi:hypothetical protein F4860DRAFT_528111 [Xylaria cubensis]|nr:hypothetical protein F4860DRAFT_528111 [Xylaria cubensis]
MIIPIITVLGYVSSTLSSHFTTSSNLSPTTPSVQRISFSSTSTGFIASSIGTSSSDSSLLSQDQAWIAGAVVGSMTDILFVVALSGFLWYYRRRRQRHELQSPFEKAKLHSDCIPRQDLKGTQNSEESLVVELKGMEQLPELPDTNKRYSGEGIWLGLTDPSLTLLET